MKVRLLIHSSFLGLALAAPLFAQPITIEHLPYHRFVNDWTNPLVVRATITSSEGTIVAAALWYRTDGGWMYVPMQAGEAPDAYEAFIPAQAGGTRILYYIRVGDSAGNLANDPPGAPGAGFTAHLFRIGHYESLYSSDLESDDGGWRSGAAAGEDDWMHGPPNVGGQNPHDPTAAYSGANVWGNDLLGGAPDEGDYPDSADSFLDSPDLDFTGRSDLWLFYRRWLTIERGVYDQARILVDGTVVWTNERFHDHLDADWVPHDVPLSPHADGRPHVTVEFRLTSDPTENLGGWTIDDIEIARRIDDARSPRVAFSDPTPRPGDTVTITIHADPDSVWYLLAADREGQGFFQVPPGRGRGRGRGGALVYTGLEQRSLRLYLSRRTDGSGVSTIVKTLPDRPGLIGRSKMVTVVGSGDGHLVMSPRVRVTVGGESR